MRPVMLMFALAMPFAGCAPRPDFSSDRCAAERGWVEAEATTPGAVQRLVGEALAACLARGS